MPNFPTSLDALANPAPTTLRNAPGFSLSGQVSTLNDIVEAIEAKLGIGAGGPPGSPAVLRRTGTGISAWGPVATVDLDPAFVLPPGSGMRKLADTTLGAASNTVNFAGLSLAYSDLMLVGYAAHSATSANIFLRFAFDAGGTTPDGANNYLWNYINSNNGIVGTSTVTADSGIAVANIGNAGYFTPFICHIPFYCLSTYHRQAYSRTMGITATTLAGVTAQVLTGMHTSNLNPIKGLQLAVVTGQILAASRFILYGLPSTLG